MHKQMTNYKGIKLCKSDMLMKQQKRRETEQRTENVQMSRTVGARRHFVLKLIRCYLLFHNAFEQTNNDNCRAFD